MFFSVLFRTSTFSSTEKLPEAFTQSNSLLYTLNISFSKIPNFTNANFPKDDIMMTYLKYWKVNTIVWNYLQIIRKYMIEWFTVWVGFLIICLYPADDAIVSIALLFVLTIWLKSPVKREQAGSSLFIWSIRVSKVLRKKFKLLLILTRWLVDTSKEALFIFRTNFSYQTNSYLENRDHPLQCLEHLAYIRYIHQLFWKTTRSSNPVKL